MATKEELLESIKSLSVLELSELVKALEEEFGVSAAAPVAVAAAPAAGGDAGASEGAEEQSEFTVTLTDIGANKINVIKTVRELTNLVFVRQRNSSRPRRQPSGRASARKKQRIRRRSLKRPAPQSL